MIHFKERAMQSRKVGMWIWQAALATLALAGLGSAQQTAADKWEKDIAAFEAQDQKSPPPKDGIVFVGSSSIRKWDLAHSFPDLPAINRGFGGSQLADSVKYAQRIVTAYRPKVVVLFAGDNDLPGGKSPEQIAEDFASFVKKVRAALPETRIVFVAIKPSPARWKFYERQQEANELVRRQCMAGKNLAFVDVVRPMLGDDGQPRRELFVQDQLHLSEAGYQLWTKLLAPHLK
jgi:lysophospholipase L1-like esterase